MPPLLTSNVPPAETLSCLVSVTTSSHAVEGVRCEVSVPPPGEDRPIVVLRPSEAQAPQLHDTPVKRIHGILRAIGGTETGEIAARDVWLRGTTTYLDHDRVTTFTGEARDFSMTNFLKPSPIRTAEVQFWISPNLGLTPPVFLHPQHSHDITVDRHLRDPIALTQEIQLQFDQVFDDWYQGDTFHRARRLVARATVPDVRLVSAVTSDLDDLLLVAGFPMRKRTVCYGWDLHTPATIVRHFRGDSGTPGSYHYPSLNFGLVFGPDFHSFLAQAWSRFRISPYQRPIRGLIYAAVPSHQRTLEGDTLALFNAIEDYLATYRRQAGLTAVVDPCTAWPKLEGILQSAIKSCADPMLDSAQRSHLYQSIKWLNRPPLEAVFTAMVKDQGVYTDDLWPIFNSQDGPSIYKIRNRLVHGDFPDSEVFTLSIVNEHLRWLIDRILLGLFDWSLDQTDVSPTFVEENYLAAREWRAVRDSLNGKLT